MESRVVGTFMYFIPLLKVHATKPPKSVITPPPKLIMRLFLSAPSSESAFHTPEQDSMVLLISPGSISIISIGVSTSRLLMK